MPLTQACKWIEALTAPLNGETVAFSLKKKLKKVTVLSCFLSCSLTSPLNDPTRFWCKVRLICWTQSFVCRAVDVCQGLCWCWVGALSSQAMNGLCMKPTSSIHLCVSRCCVLVALDKVQSNYICATVFVAVIFFFFFWNNCACWTLQPLAVLACDLPNN